MVREALFSILGTAVPDRPFFDLFAGTGAIGIEAYSRGARPVVFVERDFPAASTIEHYLQEFGIRDQSSVVRADAYRWAEKWCGAPEPVNVFAGPPYADFESRADDLLSLIGTLQGKIAPDSVLVVQAERTPFLDQLAQQPSWDIRRYGRNLLLIWVHV
jgi:16S rRNA (guanine966-N2)-methyltransferase